MLVHVIADYGPGDLAFAEVVQRLKANLPDAEPMLTPVPAFSTLAAGFCVAQLGLNPAPTGTLIYHNVAPRTDDQQARSSNAGERLAFARLATGVQVIGVNAGYAFAFIRNLAVDLRWAAVAAEGSQFRSRDLFPQAASAIALGHPDALAEQIELDLIPQIPSSSLAYVDGYGNLKTTIPHQVGQKQDQTKVQVRIGETEHQAIASDGSFAVKAGELAFAPGSSGWTDSQGQETRWMELFLRSGSAWELFDCPVVGAPIQIS